MRFDTRYIPAEALADPSRFQQLIAEDVLKYAPVPACVLDPPRTEDPLSEQKRRDWIKWRAAPYPAQRHSEYLCKPQSDLPSGGSAPEGTPRILLSAVLELPDSLDAYISTVSSSHRYDVRGRKAANAGYTSRPIRPSEESEGIWKIVHSSDERQGRPIASMFGDRPPDYGFESYMDFTDPNYRDICVGVFAPSGELAAYLLGKRVGDHVQYDEIMGHAGHISQGVTYLLHYEFLAECLRQEIPPRCLNYGPWYSGTDPFRTDGGLNRWKRKTRFRPCYLTLDHPTQTSGSAAGASSSAANPVREPR